MMKKGSKRSWIVAILVILLLIYVVFFAIKAFGNSEEKKLEEQIEAGKAYTLPPEDDAAVLNIETPYVTLHYPARWNDLLEYTVDEHDGTVTVAFAGTSSNKQVFNLFDVILSDSQEGSIGAVRLAEDRWCYVSVKVHEVHADLAGTQTDIHNFYAMQEDVNFLLEELRLVTDAEILNDLRQLAYVETPYGRLEYPSEYKTQLYVECQEAEQYSVVFIWQKDADRRIPLFTIMFGGDEESAFGIMEDSGVAVHLHVNELSEVADLNEEELNTALTLQEVINDVLAGLSLAD